MTIAEELANSTGTTGPSRQTASIMKARYGVVDLLAEYLKEDEHLDSVQQTGLWWDYIHASLVQGLIPKVYVIPRIPEPN